MECVSLLGKCRACRIKTQKEFQHHIFTTENLQQIFHEATSLEIHENDGLPGILCDDCHSRLIDSFKFRQMCASSAQVFQQIVAGEIDSDYEEKYNPPEGIDVPEEILEQDLIISQEKFSPVEIEVEQKIEKVIEPQKCRKSSRKIPSVTKIKKDFPQEESQSKRSGRKKKSSLPEESNSKAVLEETGELQEEVIPSKTQQFQCSMCNKIYTNSESLRSHIRYLHKNKDKPVNCKICGKEFQRQQLLKLHMVRLHGSEDMIKCQHQQCNRIFASKESFEMHTKEWHDPENPKDRPKNFICEICGKAFGSPAALLQHTPIHSNERPYKCNQCPKTYKIEKQLKNHILRSHKGIKNFMCPICGQKKFKQFELKIHMNIHTKEKSYTCEYCSKIFLTPQNLTLHVKTVHQGIKAYKCQHCEQSFARLGTLKHHVMTHTGEKPNECDVCGKRFIQHSALNTHKKTHGRHK